MDPAFSKNRAYYLLYLAAAFIAFMPCLLFGQAYFANDLLHYYGPARLLMKNQLAAGHFPLWNPYYFGGEPFFADPNVMACYPLLYLTLLFPLSYGLSVFFFLHMALAAFGMHFWLKSLRLSDGACRLGALTFALSGFFWWELIHPPILAAFAWFPWMMFCLERFSQKLQGGWAFATGLCFALVFCCGNFQSTSCVLYTAFAYFLFRVFLREKEAGAAPFPWKKLLIALLFMAWGGLPLIAHFLPAYEFSNYSNRAESQQDYDHFNGQFSMEPRTTYEFLYPDLGVPQGGTIEAAIQGVTDQVNIGNDFLGAFGYIGVWAPFLFILAFQRKDKKFLLFLAGISVLSIITAWGRYGGLHWLECLVLPGIKLSRAPFRFVQTYVLFGSALLAFGYQTLERWFGEKDRRFNWIWGACAYAVLLFLPALLRADQGWREMLALAVGLAGVLLGLLTNSWRTLGGFAFQAALLLPLLLNGWGSYSTGPSSNYDLETRFPPFTYLKEHRAEARYYFGQDLAYPVQIGSQTVGWPFPQDSPMDFGIRQSGGYNPIVLAKPSRLRSLTGATYFKLMAVKGILTGREMQDSPEFNHQSFGFAHLYEFKTPNPYVAAPAQVKVLPDEEQVFAAMKQADFDPARQAYFSEPLPPMLSSNPLSPNPGFSSTLQEDEMDHQSFKVHMDAAGLVVFSEIVFPGWKAWLDGQPTGLLTANYVFRGVAVPAGDHQVEFRYVPAWWSPLKALLVIWLLSAVVYGALLLRKKPSLETAKT